MMVSFFFLLGLLFSHASNHQIEQDTVWFTDSGQAEFTSSVPLHTFTGSSSNLTGLIDFDENLVDFYIDLQSIRTGNSRRDRDMYRTLDIEVYPFAEFTGHLITEVDVSSMESQTVTVSGEFTVHGVTNDIEVEGVLQKADGYYLLEAEWVLSISDYEIEPPGILFYRVRDEIDVSIKAELQPVERDAIQ
jgi:polyisoprenoid-binding protein YceI